MNATDHQLHSKYMQIALDLAAQGRYGVGANPMVGCVVVKDNIIIARGFHQQFGHNHAEINALEQIDYRAQGCDIYVTLEPCSHTGNTPPCVHSIIKSTPKRVILASLDSNPHVDSVATMQDAGIEVITGVLQDREQMLNCGFHKRMYTGLPWVRAKIAISLDGNIALNNGQSKWITGKKSRQDVQYLRAEHQAIITGSGTVLKDNPSLNVRLDDLPSPLKVIASKRKNFDTTLNIFQGEEVITSDGTPDEILTMLGAKGINYALIEAGSTLLTSFLRAHLVDELVVYQAPVLLGSDAQNMVQLSIENISDKLQLECKSVEQVGDDLKIIYTPLRML